MVGTRKPDTALAELKQAAERQSGAARRLADEIREKAGSASFEDSPDLRQKLVGWADAIERLSVEMTAAVNSGAFEEVRWYSELLTTWAKPIAVTAVGGIVAGLMVSNIAARQARAVTGEHTTIVECTINVGRMTPERLQQLTQEDFEQMTTEQLEQAIAQMQEIYRHKSEQLKPLAQEARRRLARVEEQLTLHQARGRSEDELTPAQVARLEQQQALLKQAVEE